MKFTIGSRLSLYISVLLTISITLFLTWNSAKGWLSYVYAEDPPPAGLNEAIQVESENSQLYFLLAQYYENYDFTAPREKIFELYRKALQLNPLNYNYWYYLAEFLSTEGKREKALYALNQATQLAPGVVSLRWAAGILASRLGDEEALKRNLHAVIEYDTERRRKAFIVLWQSLRNGDSILPVIPETALDDYLNFLMDTDRISEAQKVWGKLSDTDEISEYTFLRYVSTLINKNMARSAKNAWAGKYGDWEGIWNGDFEKGLTNSGFDWTFSSVKGAQVKLETNKDRGNSVRIEFDGSTNIDFYHFRQNIPVEEHTEYKLSSLMRSRDLPTKNGPFWEIYCIQTSELNVKSEEILGTTDWHPVSVTFETPRGCELLSIVLRRYTSSRVYGNIAGTVWIDDVSLKKIR
ncbi:MAG: tetratricopeptide repeat protein [Thermodesulfobacteriota bacterium]